MKETAADPTPPPAETAAVAALVTAATAGDLVAFESLVARHQAAVFNVALYKSRNYFDAEDLTQDIFLAAFRALPTLQAPERFSSWLLGIAYNRCHKWFRREKTKVVKFAEIRQRVADAERQRQRQSAEPGGSAGRVQVSGSYYAGSTSKEDHLTDELKRLPQDVRRVLTLKYLEGFSYQEIEKELNINSHRIDYLIRKGKQLLRTRLKRTGLKEGGEA